MPAYKPTSLYIELFGSAPSVSAELNFGTSPEGVQSAFPTGLDLEIIQQPPELTIQIYLGTQFSLHMYVIALPNNSSLYGISGIYQDAISDSIIQGCNIIVS